MIWISIAILSVGFFINYFVSDEHPGILFGTLLVGIGAILLMADKYEANPTAMDVYQGKTKLEIIYKDSIPVDSIVVFKDE